MNFSFGPNARSGFLFEHMRVEIMEVGNQIHIFMLHLLIFSGELIRLFVLVLNFYPWFFIFRLCASEFYAADEEENLEERRWSKIMILVFIISNLTGNGRRAREERFVNMWWQNGRKMSNC